MKRNFNLNRRWTFFLLIFIILLAAVALLLINRIVSQIKTDEKKKVQIWAKAISRKAELVTYTDVFFEQVQKEEQKRVDLFILAQKLLMEQPLDSELNFYYQFVTKNTTIPIIITDENHLILHSQNCDIPNNTKILKDSLLKEFSEASPITYTTYGFVYVLHYKESKIYTDLRQVLHNIVESFLSEITDNSVFVPVIITDGSYTRVIAAGNIKESKYNTSDRLAATIERMRSDNTPITIHLQDNETIHVFYEKSSLLKTLQYYPLIYFFVLFSFLFISYFLFTIIKKADQNKVWVGLAKETAHQLGTPISSLMAWVEYMRMKEIHLGIVPEIEKDIKRLEIIAQRFSKIGSQSELKPINIIDLLNESIAYLKPRSPKKIEFVTAFPDKKEIIVSLNAYLLEWVIENICRNAIDAMEGNGTFSIALTEDEKRVYIDFTDTGKGIHKNQMRSIFYPGYSTKQRGWGLGLSLSERIIKNYHKGKIFVKNSVIDKGTTFRVVLKKSSMR